MLRQLIAALEQHDPNRVVKRGFDNPHSYRGFYDQLAFEPAEGVTVGSMLACARGAVDRVFQGYKGGIYVMREHTDVWLANRGELGEPLSPLALECMLGSNRGSLRTEVTRILRENGIDEQEREHLRAHAAKSGKYVQAFDAVLRLIEEREGA